MESRILRKMFNRFKTAAVIAGAAVLTAVSCPHNATAAEVTVPEKIPVIMIGDRLVDVAHSMGVVPEAMSVRCSLWPMCSGLQTAVQALGCPSCLGSKKAAPMLEYIEKHGKKTVLIEKSSSFCTYTPEVDLEKIETLLKDKGLDIKYVDFTKGLETAVKQTAELIGYPEKADKVIADYKENMNKTNERIQGKKFPSTAVILKGTYQADTGKSFVQIEVPGGYADRFILDKLGIKNTGDKMVPSNKKPSKGHITVRKLDNLADAAPEAIIMTGDIASVQKLVLKAVEKNSALKNVPAVKNMKMYGLTGYIDASVMEYPMILRKWADALGE